MLFRPVWPLLLVWIQKPEHFPVSCTLDPLGTVLMVPERSQGVRRRVEFAPCGSAPLTVTLDPTPTRELRAG